MIHKRTEYRRTQERKAKKRRAETSKYSNYLHGYYETDDGWYAYMGRGSRSKWLKQQSNKKIRKGKDIGQGGWYRKKFDYWWELY